MEIISGGVCAAQGFKANGVHCGIRKNRTKRDLGLIFSEKECTAAAVDTSNLVKGAPLTVTKNNIADGKAQAGSLWSPGENPYSIPADGSVVRIFREHGWSWGGDTWAWDAAPATGYHDYMHFSYMGG